MSAVKSATCRICGVRGEMETYQLREVMFKTFETFDYQFCPACQSMQIENVPDDLHRHYPRNYYSLGDRKSSGIIHSIRSAGLRYGVDGKSMVGRLLSWTGRLPSDVTWIQACAPDLNWRVLDVGCGRGDRLMELSLAGFQNLTGIEPFIEKDIEIGPNLRIKRGVLDELTGEFDLVMLHHSLEHVVAPTETMRHVERLLSKDGKALIRVPVMGKWAWRTYGVDWVQLDAPRHLYQFSEQGIAALARSAGLRVRKVVYDSFEFQMYESERIRAYRVNGQDIPRHTKAQLAQFKKRSKELNQASDGDQACFVLTR